MSCSKVRSGHVGHVAGRLQSQNAASSNPVDGEAERLQSSQWATSHEESSQLTTEVEQARSRVSVTGRIIARLT